MVKMLQHPTLHFTVVCCTFSSTNVSCQDRQCKQLTCSSRMPENIQGGATTAPVSLNFTHRQIIRSVI